VRAAHKTGSAGHDTGRQKIFKKFEIRVLTIQEDSGILSKLSGRLDGSGPEDVEKNLKKSS